jgi:ABC-type histidine transport system ATPase subunit
MTMICVTHEMSFARDVSDRIAFFHKGVIEEIATPAKIFGAPKSEHLQSFLSNIS